MPRFDGTGPQGKGPMTGFGRGCCAGFSPFGMGQGRIMGMGHFCCPFYGICQPQTEKDQLKVLKNYKKDLEAELETVKKQEEALLKDK